MLWNFFDKHNIDFRQYMKLNTQILYFCFIVVTVFLTLTIILTFSLLPGFTQKTNFFVFAQTENTLTLPNLINQGSSHYGNTSSPPLGNR